MQSCGNLQYVTTLALPLCLALVQGNRVVSLGPGSDDVQPAAAETECRLS